MGVFLCSGYSVLALKGASAHLRAFHVYTVRNTEIKVIRGLSAFTVSSYCVRKYKSFTNQ